MLLLLSWYEFSDEKMQDSDAFYECVTDRQTDRQTDQPTDGRTQPIIVMRGRILSRRYCTRDIRRHEDEGANDQSPKHRVD